MQAPHTAAGVRHGDQLSLSLDGELQAQKTIGAHRVNTLTVNIGLEDATEAIIEDVQLYDYALFPEDIAELSAQHSPLEGGQGGVLPGIAGVSPAPVADGTSATIPLLGEPVLSLSKGVRGGSLPASVSNNSPTFGLLGSGPVVTTTITYYYINGQRVAQAKDGVFTWIHADHLSSATRITDVNGLEIRRLAYTSFGEAVENQGNGDDPKYKYTGKEADATSLYYYDARYYDPALSRFITADTVYDAGPQGLNRYSYALNNPIIFNDPTGNFSIYVHTQGAGHVGVQVNENGKLKNYDFGRYHGTYKRRHRLIRFYKGPNILKVTTGRPYVLEKKSGKLREIPVSEQLDKVIADKFKEKFNNGLPNIPQNIKKKMKNQKKLSQDERYMESDWKLFGPHCVTFSFDTLNEALDEVIESENASEQLKNEAENVKSKLEKIESIYPKGVSNNLDQKLEEQDVPPSYVRQFLPESLVKDDLEEFEEQEQEQEQERMEEE